MTPSLRPLQIHRIDPAIIAFFGGVFGLLTGLVGGAIQVAMLGPIPGLGAILIGGLLGGIRGLLVGGVGTILVNAVLTRVGGLRVEVEDAPPSET